MKKILVLMSLSIVAFSCDVKGTDEKNPNGKGLEGKKISSLDLNQNRALPVVINGTVTTLNVYNSSIPGAENLLGSLLFTLNNIVNQMTTMNSHMIPANVVSSSHPNSSIGRNLQVIPFFRSSPTIRKNLRGVLSPRFYPKASPTNLTPRNSGSKTPNMPTLSSNSFSSPKPSSRHGSPCLSSMSPLFLPPNSTCPSTLLQMSSTLNEDQDFQNADSEPITTSSSSQNQGFNSLSSQNAMDPLWDFLDNPYFPSHSNTNRICSSDLRYMLSDSDSSDEDKTSDDSISDSDSNSDSNNNNNVNAVLDNWEDLADYEENEEQKKKEKMLKKEENPKNKKERMLKKNKNLKKKEENSGRKRHTKSHVNAFLRKADKKYERKNKRFERKYPEYSFSKTVSENVKPSVQLQASQQQGQRAAQQQAPQQQAPQPYYFDNFRNYSSLGEEIEDRQANKSEKSKYQKERKKSERDALNFERFGDDTHTNE
jgi:hypothetical protein